MQDAASIMSAAEGCELIYHLAANYDLRAASEEEIIQPAIQGAESIFEAAKAHGIRRVVFTSSIVAVGTSTDPSDVRDETRWNEEPINLYYRAKTESERRVHQLATETRVEVVIVNPAMVLRTPRFSTHAFDALRARSSARHHHYHSKRSQCGLGSRRGRRTFAAADRGTPGERYIIGGENLSGKGLNQLVTKVSSARPVHMWSPRWALMLTAIIVEFLSKLLG